MLRKLIATSAIAALLALGGTAEAGSLKLGHSTWVGYGPFYIARDKGFFAKQGLEVQLSVEASWASIRRIFKVRRCNPLQHTTISVWLLTLVFLAKFIWG